MTPTVSLFSAIIDNSIIGTNYTKSNGLYYFKKYPVISSSVPLISLFNIINYSEESVPSNYTTLDLSNSVGVVFVPKKTSSLILNDYVIYTKAKYDNTYIIHHSTSDFEHFDSWSKLRSLVPTSLSYFNFYITPEKLNASSDVYAIYFELDDFNLPIELYYNSASYDVYNFTSLSSSITYNGNSIPYSNFKNNLSNYYTNWGLSNTYGASCEIFQYFDMETETCVPIGTGSGVPGVVNEDNTVEESEPFNLANFISGAWTGATTFISAGLEIIVLSTSLFNKLPSSVGAILLVMFSVGSVVVMWKIFRS